MHAPRTSSAGISIVVSRLCAFAVALGAVVGGMAPSAAHAQWMWKDESGHVIASDQAPPPGTPQSRILKEPRARPPGAPAAATAQPDPQATADAQKSLADRELDFKKRQQEQADAQKKSDDEAAKARALAANCAAVKSNVAALQSGGRAARFNEKGEKVYIDDADRASEISKQQSQIAQYCR